MKISSVELDKGAHTFNFHTQEVIKGDSMVSLLYMLSFQTSQGCIVKEKNKRKEKTKEKKSSSVHITW